MRRRIHYGDVAALARALMGMAPDDRVPACLRMIRQAQSAEAHRRETGQLHPLWGSGSLMEVARKTPQSAEAGFDDPAYRAAFLLVLHCLQKALAERGAGEDRLQ